MARTSSKDRDPNDMVMGTFRIKSGVWEDFKQLASQNNATATDLIISFIGNCLQSQSVPKSRQNIDNSQSNLDTLYKYIDSKLENIDIQSRQNTVVSSQPNLDTIYTYIDDKLDNQSIQNIDETVKKIIAESLGDGEIKSAINQRYEDAMGQVNQLLDDYHQLESKVAEIKDKLTELEKSKPITSYQSITTNPQPPIINEELPPGEVVEVGDGESDRLKPGSELLDLKSEDPSNPQSTMTDKQFVELEGTGQVSTEVSEPAPNDQSLITDDQPLTDKQQKILDILGIDLAIAQRPITPDVIKRLGIGRKIKSNQVKLEAILKSKLDMKSGYVRRVGNILKAAGFDVGGNEKAGYCVIVE